MGRQPWPELGCCAKEEEEEEEKAEEEHKTFNTNVILFSY
jgi:hypothetical protein